MSLSLDRHDPGSTIDSDDLNDAADALEDVLNGPDATPAGTGLGDTNWAAGAPVVVGANVAALAPVRGGKTALLRVGATPFDSVALVYDASLTKWVSEAAPAVQQQETDGIPAGASYLDGESAFFPKHLIPNFKLLYDAGLRPQVFVAALLDNTGANDTFFRAVIKGFADGDDALSAELLTGGEISNNGTTGRYQVDSGWETMAGSAPTEAHAYLIAQTRAETTSGTVDDGSIWLRWVSA